MESDVSIKGHVQKNPWQIVMLRVALHSDLTYQSEEDAYILKLPQTDEQLRAAREHLGVKTFGECEVQWIDSPLRALNELSYDGDISLMNALAKSAAQAFNGGYESTMLLLAALDAFRYNGKDALKECLEHLDRYELLPEEYCTPEAYGKHVFYFSPQRDDVHVDESMWPYIDFEKYGRALMEENRIHITELGWVVPKVSTCKLYTPLTCKTSSGYELDAEEMVLFRKEIAGQIDIHVKNTLGPKGLTSSTASAYYPVGRVLSVLPGVEVQNGELWGCLSITKRGWIPEKEWEVLTRSWYNQLKSGWREHIRIQGVACAQGDLFLDFCNGNSEHRFFSEKELEDMGEHTDWVLE